MKLKTAIPALISGACITISCETQVDAPKSDFLSMPTLIVENSQTVMADSGKIELIMSFPLMEQYTHVEKPYYEFTKGIRVDFFDGDTVLHGSVTAKYAKFDETSEIWELKDSVIVINIEGDKLETELLNWDQKKDLIYTDRFVKMTGPEQITQGIGFEADSHLNRQHIKKVSAVIYVEDEE